MCPGHAPIVFLALSNALSLTASQQGRGRGRAGRRARRRHLSGPRDLDVNILMCSSRERAHNVVCVNVTW